MPIVQSSKPSPFFLFLLFWTLQSTSLSAQSLEWANAYTSFSVSAAVATDPSGHGSYLTAIGRTGDNVNPRGTSMPIPGPANTNLAYITRYDSSGRAVWVRSFTGKVANSISGLYQEGGGARKIELNPRGYVHVMWQTSAGADQFYPGGQVLDTRPGAVLLTLDTAGNLVHNLPFISDSITVIRAMAVDANGLLTVVGSFSGTLTLGNKTLTSTGKKDGFIFKFNPAQYDPAQTYLGQIGGVEIDDCNGVAIDGLGNTYIGGIFRGVCDMDPDPASFDQLNIGSDFDVFLVKLNSNMEYEWSKRINTTLQYMGRLEVNPQNEVYANAYTNALKYHFVKIGGNGEELDKLPYRGNTVLVIGTETIWSFDTSGILHLLSSDTLHNFPTARLTKYDTSGLELSTTVLSGTNLVAGYGFDLDRKGDMYLTGFHKGSVDLDPDTSVFLATAVAPTPDRTFFVKWRLSTPDTTSAVYEQDLPFGLTLYPNPVQPGHDLKLRIAGAYHGLLHVKIWSADGQCRKEAWVQKHGDMLELPLALPEKANGALFISLTDQNGHVLTKKVIELD